MTEPLLIVSELIGSGLHRDCWVHPHDQQLCIKTTKIAGQDSYQSYADVLNFHQLEKKGVVGIHVPRLYGWVTTNRGRGLVCERILDECGTPSPTLAIAVRNRLIDAEEASRLVNDLFQKLIQLNIVVRDTNSKNLLVRTNAAHGRHLVIVDGVGHTATGPKEFLRDRFPFLGRYRTKKEFRITRRRLVTLFASLEPEGTASGGKTSDQRRAA